MCDHKNLTYTDAKHVNPRVLRQKLEVDEVYGAKWHHVAGVENPGGDALSRLATFKETPKLLDAERYDSTRLGMVTMIYSTLLYVKIYGHLILKVPLRYKYQLSIKLFYCVPCRV